MSLIVQFDLRRDVFSCLIGGAGALDSRLGVVHQMEGIDVLRHVLRLNDYAEVTVDALVPVVDDKVGPRSVELVDGDLGQVHDNVPNKLLGLPANRRQD